MKRTRENSAPLNARVTLDLAHRLRQHVLQRHDEHRTISAFVSVAIEEKLAREAPDAQAID